MSGLPHVQWREPAEPPDRGIGPSHGAAGEGQHEGEGEAGPLSSSCGHRRAVIGAALGQAPDRFVRLPIGRTEQWADRLQKTPRRQGRRHAEAAL